MTVVFIKTFKKGYLKFDVALLKNREAPGFLIYFFRYYLGKTKFTPARHPKSGLDAKGPPTGIRGPNDKDTICLPNLVTADTEGIIKAVVLLLFQFCVISPDKPMPAPLFQL